MLAEEQSQIDQIVNKPLSEEVILAPDNEDDPAAAVDDGFSQLLGGHTIGPLVQEYESHI